MFAVTEADATVIRTAFEQEGELSAAIEVRRLFPMTKPLRGSSPSCRLGTTFIGPGGRF